MNNLRYIILFILSVLCGFARAQELGPPMEWGEVSKEDLSMTSYAPDSNATAVVLFDYGEATFDQHYDLIYKHHRRIKILSKAGFDWGTHSFSYYKEGGTQRVSDLEGQTMVLGPDGEVVANEMDDDAVFDEESGENWNRMKFTLPALVPGCIVEYRYTIRSTNPWYMPDWEFQKSEPVVWSEFHIKAPTVFVYAIVTLGYLPFHINTNELVKETFMGPAGAVIVQMNSARYVIKDIPAMREEPYVTTLDDYRSRMTTQLAIINWPGEHGRRFLESWQKVAEELDDHTKFGKQLSGFGAVRKQTEDIIKPISDPMQRLEAVYDFVRNTIVWNGRYRIFASDDLDDVLESKSGSSADINLLLAIMLRDAKIDAQPVLLSTRGNGKIQTIYPMVNQFDYVIVRATVGNREFLVDATDRFRPYCLLPTRALNHTGFLIKEDKYEWVSIEPVGKGKQSTMVDATLNPDGSVSGKAQLSFSDYSASYERGKYAKEKEDDYIKFRFKTETSGIVVDSFMVDKKDSLSANFRINANISSSSYAQVLNEFIYFNPFLVDRSNENPFRLEKRMFPVDFAYPLSGTYTANFKIPEGFALKEMPKDVNVRLPLNGGSYSRAAQATETGVQVVARFEINQIVFMQQQYAGLRNFYDRVVAAENEQFVLEKKQMQPESPAPSAAKSVPVKSASKRKK